MQILLAAGVTGETGGTFFLHHHDCGLLWVVGWRSPSLKCKLCAHWSILQAQRQCSDHALKMTNVRDISLREEKNLQPRNLAHTTVE